MVALAVSWTWYELLIVGVSAPFCFLQVLGIQAAGPHGRPDCCCRPFPEAEAAATGVKHWLVRNSG